MYRSYYFLTVFILCFLFLAREGICETKSVSISSNPLIRYNMSESERNKVLSSYFSPSFNEILEVDLRSDINKNVKDPMKLRGVIYINPPKSHCFTIVYDETKKDKKICEKAQIYYKLSDLNDNGEFKLDISTDDSNEVYTYTWKSKYKFVQVYPSIRDKYVSVKKYPVMDCLPNIKNRKIELDLFFTKWFLTIPSQDIKAEEFEKDLKPVDKEKINWKLHTDKSFGLDPDNVIVGDYPPSAVQSRCRYIRQESTHKYKNMVECHNIGLYDAVRIPVDCMFK